ncbi:MAG TPA: FtsX-like permease family protein [Vicinamibacterales bacterium]|nr:FtsX-like permease family protein [Vicinamibacterales bacterium]
MTTILKIAWRNIWRNRRRTFISMSAVGVGLMLVILYSGMMAGVLGDAKEQLSNLGMGHVEITAAGWRTQRGAGDNIESPDTLVARLNLPPRSRVGWRVVSRGLITSARASEGIELQGVDWARESQLSAHLRDVRSGLRPTAEDLNGILIGDRLADRLKVKVGSKVRVMTERADGEIGAELYRVRGIFHSLSPMISEHRVLVGERSARALLGVGDVAHQIVIQLDRASEAEQVAGRLRAELGPRYEVLSYGELLPALRNIERFSDAMLWISAVFIYGLVGLGILNTTLMSVLERTREFGVLRAIGTRPGRLVAQVLGESFWIATLSGAAGLAAGLALTWYGSEHALMTLGTAEAFEYAGTVMRAGVKTRFLPGAALEAASLVYVMASITALYPAWKVARLPPARALHSS